MRLLSTEPAARATAMAVFVGFAVRLTWILVATRDPVGEHDPSVYADLAGSLADGDGYVGPTGAPTAYFPPGYPGVLAVVVLLVRHTPLPGGVAAAGAGLNLILGTATIVLVALLARRLLGPAVGAAAAWVVALYPSLVIYTSSLLSETLCTAVLLTALAVLLWNPWREADGSPAPPSPGRLAVVGALLGFVVLIRPPVGGAILGIAAALLLARRDLKRWLLGTAVLVLAAVLVVAPWMLRNSVRMEALVLSTNTGDNLCIGNHPGAPGSFALPPFCFADVPAHDPPRSEVEQNRMLTDRALSWIAENPLAQPRLVALRLYYTFLNDREAVRAATSYGSDPWLSPRREEALMALSDAWYYASLVLAGIGVAAAPLRRDPRLVALLAVAAGTVVTMLPFFGEARFHVPLLPLVAIFAAIPLTGRPSMRAALQEQRSAETDQPTVGSRTTT